MRKVISAMEIPLKGWAAVRFYGKISRPGYLEGSSSEADFRERDETTFFPEKLLLCGIRINSWPEQRSLSHQHGLQPRDFRPGLWFRETAYGNLHRQQRDGGIMGDASSEIEQSHRESGGFFIYIVFLYQGICSFRKKASSLRCLKKPRGRV